MYFFQLPVKYYFLYINQIVVGTVTLNRPMNQSLGIGSWSIRRIKPYWTCLDVKLEARTMILQLSTHAVLQFNLPKVKKQKIPQFI